jgi:histidyl-tRNA synthetase
MQQHTGPARGMRDFLPEEIRRRQYVIDVIRRVYERYGFEPLETPALENIETLTGKYGEEGNKLIYKVLRRGEGESSGETDLALRYDLTVPLARVVADNPGKLPRFFKRYQIQPVWRADRPARGRFREFYQCDVDAIGSTSPVVEAEMIAAVSEVLQTLGFKDFVVQLNHRYLLTAMLDTVGVDRARHADVLVAIDKLDKIGDDGVVADMVSRGLSQEVARSVLVKSQEIIDKRWRAEFFSLDPAAVAASENLTQILTLCESTPAAGHLQYTPRLARGLSYYTGAIMEIAVPDLAGSLGGGGRYDGLIGMFSGAQIPACGFSLGLERILVVMTERGMFPAEVQSGGPDVLLTTFDDEFAATSLRLATELRAADLRVELYPESTKRGKNLGKALKYASERNARFVAIIEEDELTRNEVKLRNTKTREQLLVPQSGIADRIRALLAGADDRTSPLDPRTSDTE